VVRFTDTGPAVSIGQMPLAPRRLIDRAVRAADDVDRYPSSVTTCHE